MPPTIEYASPTPSATDIQDRNLHRYFVYAIDSQTIRAVRFEAHAYGLTNLVAVLKAKAYMPELVVVDPDPAIVEPPGLDVYINHALASGDDATRQRLQVMAGNGGEAGYKLASAIAPGSPKNRAAVDRNLLLHTPTGFASPGPESQLPGQARATLGRLGLWCGIVDAGIGLLGMYGIFSQSQPNAPMLITAFMLLVMFVAPGVTMLVMGIDQLKYRRWVPIVATAIGGLVLLLLALSAVGNMMDTSRRDNVTVWGTFGLIALNGAYLITAIRALREK